MKNLLEIILMSVGVVIYATITGEYLNSMFSVPHMGYVLSSLVATTTGGMIHISLVERKFHSIVAALLLVCGSGYFSYIATSHAQIINSTDVELITQNKVEINDLIEAKKDQFYLVRKWERKLSTGNKQSEDTQNSLEKSRFDLTATEIRIDKLKVENKALKTPKGNSSPVVVMLFIEAYFMFIAWLFNRKVESIVNKADDKAIGFDDKVSTLVTTPTEREVEKQDNPIDIKTLTYVELYEKIAEKGEYLTATELMKYVEVAGVESPNPVQVGLMMKRFKIKKKGVKGYLISKPKVELREVK